MRGDAVLVGAPDAAVEAIEGGAGAFLAAEPQAAVQEPETYHLKPTGTSYRRRPSRAATRSIMALLTTVLPTAASGFHCVRWRNK
jgi:hypothetical protein